MKTTKTLELGKLRIKAVIQDFHATEMTVAGVKLDLAQAKDLVTWVQTEVLGVSTLVPATSHAPLTPVPMPPGPTGVQTFPAIEARVANPKLASKITRIESAVKPGEIDPLADRRVDPSERVKFKQVTDPREVGSLAGVELRGGEVDNPIKVKL